MTTPTGGGATTQRVTGKDLDAGRVRLPRSAKRLLPSQRCDVEIAVRGHLMRARWDPKTDGERERSGVLAFGRGKLAGLVGVDEVLRLSNVEGRFELR